MKYSLNKMMALDVYLSALNNADYKTVVNTLEPDNKGRMPLQSWDVIKEARLSLFEKAERQRDINCIKTLAKKLHWKNNIDTIFNNANFEALVVTDLHQNIVWVNKGFTKMTGYAKVEALNKTPRFLQGPETNVNTKTQIKNNLKQNVPFKTQVINYKKNGTKYNCEVKIFPLFNYTSKTHFIALEQQVS